MEWISQMFGQYGYFVLFFGLFAESLALPFPGELAMAIAGHMASLGTFQLTSIILVSYLGAITGTLVTYMLGRRLGTPFFEKYGKYFFLKPERLRQLTEWFGKYGDKLILVSYFVPGLRHFTGYVAGILKVRLGTLLLYNGIGGILWVMTYVTVGHIFGAKIEQLLHLITQYSFGAVVVLALLAGLAVLARKKKALLIQWLRARYEGLQKLFVRSVK
ncbi:DedA family protein [Paenibacillus tyrfis]|uniref:DedA family protein n=1 Tax=Paenibacillus tyrfis TaxID=1501230 RepID=UPI00209FF2BD|nr:DedA family protein [Paenibacillus tyrfis]MCP1306242.1 DedA family protein [Paenibacillus tyrfis]